MILWRNNYDDKSNRRLHKESLIDEAKALALEFVDFLRNNNIEFYKDNSSCWKDKIYYWLKFKGECVAFIAIKDPDNLKIFGLFGLMIVQLLATTLWMMKSRTMLGIILISVLIAVLVTAAKIKSSSEKNLTECVVAHLESIIHNEAIYLS